jgi:myo-inositol-1(or 4)-monophosphatase
VDPLAFVASLAREAGTLLRERLAQPREIAQKAQADLVTDADHASEALIVTRIREYFPQAAILGEEGGTYVGSSDERFIVDPLDGTTNYAHRNPFFCVSIGYEVGGKLEAGAIYGPVFDELFAARAGCGATCNGVPIHVSSTARVAEAMVGTGFTPMRFDERNIREWTLFSRRAQAVRRNGSAALDLASVAAGRFDGFWEWNLHPWDVAAGVLIVREAGGTVSAIDGGAFEIDGCSVLATNGTIHDEMRRLLAGEEIAPPPKP